MNMIIFINKKKNVDIKKSQKIDISFLYNYFHTVNESKEIDIFF